MPRESIRSHSDRAFSVSIRRAAVAFRGRLPGNFAILLIALFAFILIPSFFVPAGPDHDHSGRLLMPIFLSAVLLLALNSFPRNRRLEFTIAIILAAIGLGCRWALIANDNRGLIIAAAITWALFLGFSVAMILHEVLTAKRITYDTICGAICGYLIFGMTCAFVYALIELAYPHSFAEFSTPLLLRSGADVEASIYRFLYFSLVTLASVGYGDITPISQPARMFSAMEGIAGQFYIAILIARLVSLNSSRWSAE